jgi:hypothetical protein
MWTPKFSLGSTNCAGSLVAKMAMMALKSKRLRQLGRRPLKSTFLQSKTWENTGNALAFVAGALALFAGIPAVLAGLIWFFVGAILVFVLPNYDYAKRRQEADEAYQRELTKDPRKALLIGAESHLRTLGSAFGKLPPTLARHVETLHTSATAILNAVDADIGKSVPIVTFFTTHLPDAARLAKERVHLTRGGTSEQRSQIDQALDALTHEFSAAQTAMMAPELAAVDIDVRLLVNSMDVEVEDLAR